MSGLDTNSLLALVNLVLGVTVLEALALFGLHRFKGRGLAPQDYLLNLLSGLCLVLALRAALVSAAWYWPALCLLLSGLLHGADLLRRWKQRAGAAEASPR